MSAAVTYDRSGLIKLVQAVGRLRLLKVQVGIFSDKAARKATGDEEGQPLNNAEIGLIHEKGSLSRNIPARSFLMMPLGLRFRHRMDKTGADQWLESLVEAGPTQTAALIGVEAENTVQQAFETGGWGAWPRWSMNYTRRRELKNRFKTGRMNFVGPVNPGSLLIDSAQLRRSVSSRVVGGAQ